MNGTGNQQDISADTVPRHRRSPVQNEAKATRVYVIRRDDETGCKVGVSSHPKRRLSGLQVSTPAGLSLFFQFRPSNHSARAVEAAVLELLRPWRVRGEWLNCHPFIAQKAAEAIDASQDIALFLALLQERSRRWAMVEDAQRRNETRYQNEETAAAFAFYRENEKVCWESRIDIMRVIDPWGRAVYDEEDIGFQNRRAAAGRPRRRKRLLFAGCSGRAR